MKINFSKYQATGNDFIVIDNRKSNFSSSFLIDLAKKMCLRKFSVGADGLLVLEDASKADIKMRIINPDGSEVEMCGNGLRCMALFAKELGICKDHLTIQTLAGDMKAYIKNCNVKLKLHSPKDIELNFDLTLSDGPKLNCSFLNTGVPHVVTFLDDVNEVNVSELGRAIRYHNKFKPQGTNANFVKVIDKNTIQIRSYERGVEDETLACGTGAVASAVIATLLNLVHSPVKVNTRSRQDLIISFDKKNSKISQLFMEGEVSLVYRGEIEVRDY